MSLTFHDDNPLLPELSISPKLKVALCEPWENALVVKPLGRNIGYMTLEKKVKELWKPRGEIEIVILGHGTILSNLRTPRIEKKSSLMALG